MMKFDSHNNTSLPTRSTSLGALFVMSTIILFYLIKISGNVSLLDLIVIAAFPLCFFANAKYKVALMFLCFGRH